MLSNRDIEFMRKSREEIRSKRTYEVILYGETVTGKHPVTGEEIIDKFSHEVDAVVMEVSVRTAVDRYRHDGIEVRAGDIVIDISLKDVPDEITSESVTSLKYKEIDYTVVASADLGLGGYNRIEVVGRRTQ